MVEVDFPFAPDFNQTSTVQPDGFVALKGAPSVPAVDKTLAELSEGIDMAYANILREPEAKGAVRSVR